MWCRLRFFAVMIHMLLQKRWQTNRSIKTFTGNSVKQFAEAKLYETVGVCKITETVMDDCDCQLMLDFSEDKKKAVCNNHLTHFVRWKKETLNEEGRIFLLEFLYGWKNGLQSDRLAEPSLQVYGSLDWQSPCCRLEVPESAASVAAAGWSGCLTWAETPASKKDRQGQSETHRENIHPRKQDMNPYLSDTCQVWSVKTHGRTSLSC